MPRARGQHHHDVVAHPVVACTAYATRDILSTQPNDHLSVIFNFADGRDLLRMCRVSKRLAVMARRSLPAVSERLNRAFDCAGRKLPGDEVVRRYAVPGVTRIDFACIPGVDIEAIATRCGPLLNTLRAGGRVQTDSVIESVAVRCPGLTVLDVSWCSTLTDRALEAVAAWCPGLTTLSVSSCELLTDRALEAVTTRCRGLTSLDVRGCTLLTDRALEAAVARCRAHTLRWKRV